MRWSLLLALTATAAAADVQPGVRVDGAVQLPLSEPQRTYLGLGPQLTLTGVLELMPPFDVELGLTWSLAPPTPVAPISQPATALGLLAGVRLKRPLDGRQVIPWFAAQLGWTLTGLSTLSLAPAAGVFFRVSPTSPLLFGPMLRFTQLFKFGELPGRSSYDASLLAFGLGVEFAPRAAPPPPPPPDRDGDGLADPVDACPNEAGPPPTGCPPPRPPKDTDGDGLADPDDACATAPEDRDGFEDGDGCPDPDDDRDGVLDGADRCPRVFGSVEAQGCPDGDGDGVADGEDRCPKARGTRADHGCPTYRDVVVTETRLEILQKIFFAFGTTTILPKSHPLLGEVVQALQDREVLCVRIEGHTDAVGNAEANLKLSNGRAAAVRDFLVSAGVAAGRLSSKGYGSTLPIDSNATLTGRENNRRVEFVLVPCGKQE